MAEFSRRDHTDRLAHPFTRRGFSGASFVHIYIQRSRHQQRSSVTPPPTNTPLRQPQPSNRYPDVTAPRLNDHHHPTIAQLSILSVTPNTAPANTTVNVTLSGTAFANGATVSFEGAEGTAPQVTGTQVVNANTIVITVNAAVDTGATTQVWDVRVTNPDNTFVVLQNAFTVNVP
jgi:hypothetical protein